MILFRSTRLALMLLALAVVWALCGAPIRPEEFTALPSDALRWLRQTPMRMLNLFALWFA